MDPDQTIPARFGRDRLDRQTRVGRRHPVAPIGRRPRGDQAVLHGGATTQFDRALPRLGARQLAASTHAMNVGPRIEALRHLLHHHTDRRLIDPLLAAAGPSWTRKEPPRSVLELLSPMDLHRIARAIATTKTLMVLGEDVEGDVDGLDHLLTPDGTPTSWQHRILDGTEEEP